jgi:hypothetical protein
MRSFVIVVPVTRSQMEEPDYEDPAVDQQWCCDIRQRVADYLGLQRVEHGEIGAWPAWHVAPYVSIWAIESLKSPGWVGWWVICGDMPSDYVSAAKIKHPREAMRAFAQQWKDVSAHMRAGIRHPDTNIGTPERAAELAPLLESRAGLLAQWAEDDGAWGPEYD